MEAKDKVISRALDEINTRLGAHEKCQVKDFKPKTNCRFAYTEEPNAPQINIRTVNDEAKLIKMLAHIRILFNEYNDINKIYKAERFTYLNFTMEDWENDFNYFINKIISTKFIEQQTTAKAELENLFSQEQKDKNKINSILKDLGLDLNIQ